ERSRVRMDRRARESEAGGSALYGGWRRTSQGSAGPVRRHRRSSAERCAMTFDPASLTIILPALAAGVLVIATHVPLGAQVLARGIVFVDLAIAQIAGCGVLLADAFGFEPERSAV